MIVLCIALCALVYTQSARPRGAVCVQSFIVINYFVSGVVVLVAVGSAVCASCPVHCQKTSRAQQSLCSSARNVLASQRPDTTRGHEATTVTWATSSMRVVQRQRVLGVASTGGGSFEARFDLTREGGAKRTPCLPAPRLRCALARAEIRDRGSAIAGVLSRECCRSGFHKIDT